MDPGVPEDTDMSSAYIAVETGGLLKVVGRSAVHVLTPAVLQLSHILADVAEAASEGDSVPLPLTRVMVDAWLAAIGMEYWLLRHLVSSSLQLAQTLAVRNAIAAVATVMSGLLRRLRWLIE